MVARLILSGQQKRFTGKRHEVARNVGPGLSRPPRSARLAAAPAARAEDYPSRPIKLVVPYAAGGPTDVLGRLVGDFLGRDLKQPVIVENKAGAQGAIGAEAVARADPDGVIPVRPPAKIGIKARHSRDSATL